jgi:hypothetical protein
MSEQCLHTIIQAGSANNKKKTYTISIDIIYKDVCICKHIYIDTRNSPGCPKVDNGGFVVRSDNANGGRFLFHGIQALNRLNGMRVLQRIIHGGQGNAKDGHDSVATFDDG